MKSSGEIDLRAGMLIGKIALVTLEVQTYFDKNGVEKERNNVPWDGYDESTIKIEETEESEELPF